jgi:tetratricopeptide (TPR) repeat protein
MKFTERIQQAFSKESTYIWILVLLGILIYVNCLPNEMFWDDDDFILKNVFLQDWSYFPRFFTDNVISGAHLLSNYWRPLLMTIFAVEWHLWADWVYGWHAVSIVAHIAAGIVLFKALDAIFKDRTLSFLAALVFIVHPVQTEAVVYPNAMGDSLADIFIFLALYFYTRFRRNKHPAPFSLNWWLALGMFPLALLSKETGILIAGFVPLADYMLQPAKDGFRKRIWNIFKAAWPFLASAAGYILMRATILNINNSFNFYKEANTFTTDFGVRVLTFFKVLSMYAGLLFIPYDLRVERIIDPPKTLLHPDVLWGAILFGFLVYLAIRNWKKKPLITFGILWFFIGILPTSNLFVIINAMIYEHFLYTSLVGIFLIIFWLGLKWADTEQKRRVFWALTVCMITFFSLRSFWRTFDWRTSIGFYEKLTETASKSYRVLNNLGMEYAKKDFDAKAEAMYKKAIALDPTNAVSYHNLANLYRDQGRKAQAIALYEKAIALQDNFIFSYVPLARAYQSVGELQKARDILERLFLRTDEQLPVLQFLFNIAYQQEDYPAARKYILTALKLMPDNPNLLKTLKTVESLMNK